MMNIVEDYLKLSYKTVLMRNDDGTYFAKIEELPGCITEGETITDALEMIEDAKKDWIATAIDAGIEIPLPDSMQKKYSRARKEEA
jgi:antitoxin HicB